VIYALISRLQGRPKHYKYNGKSQVIFVLTTAKEKLTRDNNKLRDNANEFVAGEVNLEGQCKELWEKFNRDMKTAPD